MKKTINSKKNNSINVLMIIAVIFGITSNSYAISTPHINTEYKFLKKQCKDEYTSVVDFRVCSVNKIIGLAQLEPHMKIIKKLPKFKEYRVNCVSFLNLKSRKIDYDQAIKCLSKSHGQALHLKTKESLVKGNFDKMSADELTNLGELFLYGAVVKQDLNFATELFIKASEKGNKTAPEDLMLMLHYINSNNIYISKDVRKAIFEAIAKYYILDKSKNNNSARTAYSKGKRAAREKKYKEAKKWYQLAAEKNNPEIINKIAIIYAKGKGVPKDVPLAIQLYTKSANLGYDYAQQTLGNRYVTGRGVVKDVEKGLKYYKQAVKQGHIKAAYELAEIYRKGKIVDKNYKKAYDYYLVATKGNHKYQYKKQLAESFAWIGYFYEYAKGVEKDLSEALSWYTNAANLGNTYAMRTIGNFYFNGKVVEKDLAEAFKWYSQAAEHGDKNSMYEIATQLWNGSGVAKDRKTASKWYHKAARLNNSASQYWLGEMYARGEVVARDLEKACKWTLKAANNGHKTAKSNYARFCQ